MTLIERIKLDREAGTAGPWTEMHDHPDPATAASLANIRSEANECGYAADIAHVFGCDHTHDGRQEQKHNARRIARVPEMEEALMAAVEALTPSGATKACYIGEFSHAVTITDENGDEEHMEVVIPWTTIKEIMAAIRLRAGLPEGSND